MRKHAKEPNVPRSTSALPLVGVAGTVAGMLFAFDRTGAEPLGETVLQAVGVSVAVTGAILIVLRQFGVVH